MSARAILLGAAAIIALGGAFGLNRLDRMAMVPAAYKAKALCSEIFLAGRAPEAVLAVEFTGIDPFIDRTRVAIDGEGLGVTASLFGLGRTRASYREGHGCTIERGRLAPLAALSPIEDRPWPESLRDSEQRLRRVDYEDVEAALDAAFADPAAGHRALVLIVDGRLVAERYADGFSAQTPMLSWSMAKSVTATLVGAAVRKGWVDISAPAPVPEWRGDPDRSRITWNDLLKMQSGLAFDETYGDPNSDVSEALFRAHDAGGVAARKRAIAPPGEVWNYSSGTTNLIMRTLRAELAARGVELAAFARSEVFAPIGAASFVLEPDSSGTPIGSSYVYATARDWAKLGQLYLDGGVAVGQRVLPEGWTDYVREAAPASDDGYGAQFWLNSDGAARPRSVPGLSAQMFYMAGHEGQYVFIVPDKNAVIVRLGMTRGVSRPIEPAGRAAASLAAAISDLPLAEAAEPLSAQ
jgi:CubicO group peptidase (beta-lactamase class C family)